MRRHESIFNAIGAMVLLLALALAFRCAEDAEAEALPPEPAVESGDDPCGKGVQWI